MEHQSESFTHEQGSLTSYVIGFVLSILLTLASFFFVSTNALKGWPLYLVIAAFALLQAIIQLIFFLHLGQESKPKKTLIIFLFMLLVISILVFGSLWIMYNLEERLMPTMSM